jgi:sugar phosphate isomerase/epimerase
MEAIEAVYSIYKPDIMKLAFSTNAFKKYTLEESITSIADIGYEGVEILCDIPHAYPPTFNPDEIQSVKNLISVCDMQISNLNAFSLYAISDVYHPSWIEADKRLRELRLQHTIDCVQLAEKIGARNISTEPGGPMDINSHYNNFSRGQLQRLFLKGLSRAAEVAEKCGIKILVEPEPGLLLENSHEFLSFIKNLRYDSVGLNFDISHFYCVRQDPANLIYQLCEYIGHFHLADISGDRSHYHLIPGKGSIDFGSVFRAIEEVGYKGFVTVELYPYQDDPIEAAKVAYEYLNDIIT